MIFYEQCFALYAIIKGEIAYNSATVPALVKLDPRSFRNLFPGRICDFAVVVFIIILCIIFRLNK